MVLGIERLQTNEGGQDVQCGDILFVANTGHFHNEIDSAGSEGFDGIKVHIINPHVDRFVFPLVTAYPCRLQPYNNVAYLLPKRLDEKAEK